MTLTTTINALTEESTMQTAQTTGSTANTRAVEKFHLNSTIDGIFDEIGITNSQRTVVGLHLLTMFSSAIGHTAYTVENGARTYGNLCNVLVGKTGVGKGASWRYTRGMFTGFGEDVISPTLESTRNSSMKIKLREIDAILGDSRRRTMGEIRLFHINEEFETELAAASHLRQSGLSGFNCKLIDGSPISETLGRQCINYALVHYSLMAHIQPERLRRCHNSGLILNGFSNRLLWHAVPEGFSLPLPSMSQEIHTQIEDEIRASIAFAIGKRQVNFSPDAKGLYEIFINSLCQEISNEDELIQAMCSRFPQHAAKLALVYAMLRREEEIQLGSVADAIHVIAATEGVIKRYLLIPPRETIESAIIRTIKEAGCISPSELIKPLLKNWAIQKIRRTLQHLESAGIISCQIIDNKDGTFPQRYVASN